MHPVAVYSAKKEVLFIENYIVAVYLHPLNANATLAQR